MPNNLPLQLTSFVGREKEIADIKSLLNSARLITLTGSGGTGKTRLSQEVGAEELSSFTNGVWLIELAPLSDPAQIIPALAQVFGLQELPFNPLANLVLDYLRDKKILIILDNCEHLIEACARLADDLLHQCAGLKILASSREALGIAGEVAYHTPSLADAESTQLFADRARAANAKFQSDGYECLSHRTNLPPARRHSVGDRVGRRARQVALRPNKSQRGSTIASGCSSVGVAPPCRASRPCAP